ncbi:Glutathione S-transferase family protein [Sulfitobacter noctilucae]|uniref:glutathione S-transferase n=1 Tax=Sulfitobacter noctilucae TaxID=1342302 RepID=UPI000469CF37|nr:glutathione S-transferase [Sulfitobacter noctilucae]KIN75087.1 Glutathione S-transferase family protein [Sulfitobacter noctilucae]
MTYDLYIGDRTFSSWSLRGWLMLEKFNLPYKAHLVGLYGGTMAADLAALAPARLVPVLRTPEGTVVGESLAMAETLAERHPEAGMWPKDAAARATARWLCAEICAGFSTLRGSCPMQLQHVNEGFAVSAELQKDIDRLETLWAHAGAVRTENGLWLFGGYSLADAFYAPVAARIIGYDLPVSATARAYCETTISDPAFKAWRAEGLEVVYDPFPYDFGGATREWPSS